MSRNRTEASVFLKAHQENQLIGKDPDAGKDWRQEEKGKTQGEMVGWHYQLNGHEFEQAPGIGDGQESLVCCSLWGCKELDVTGWLNWTELEGFNVQPRLRTTSSEQDSLCPVLAPLKVHCGICPNHWGPHESIISWKCSSLKMHWIVHRSYQASQLSPVCLKCAHNTPSSVHTCLRVQSLSHDRLLATPWTAA